jgi:hypothetical protein
MTEANQMSEALSPEDIAGVSGGGGFHGSGTRQEEGGGGTLGSGT